jgi:hypothetical protein
MPCPSHHHCLDHSNYIRRKVQAAHLYNFLQPSTISCLFRPDILFSTPFSYIFSLCSSLNVREQVHTHTKRQAKL